MEKVKTDSFTLRKFGLTMALALAAAALFIFLKHRAWVPLMPVISVLFLLAGLAIPRSLKYFYIVWMRLAFILGWFNTKLLLCVIFYLIFTPIGLIMRLFRADPLERKIIPGNLSYWKYKDNKEQLPENYEKQF